MIYLDNSATTYPKPDCVYDFVDQLNREYAFNAGRGSYREAKNALNIISNARKAVAELISTSSENVVFTSSATEALNAIVFGMDLQPGDTVYVSPFEHNSIIRPLKHIEGLKIEIIPFDEKTWNLKEDMLKDLMAVNKPKAVFLSHVSNTVGYELPYEQVFNLSKKYGAINVLDCSQSFGVITPRKVNVDYIVFAGHKSLYGVFGVGGFIKLGNDFLKLNKYGGSGSDSLNPEMPEQMPDHYESGSMNVVAIGSLIKSIEWLKNQNIKEYEIELIDYLKNKLKQIDGITVYEAVGKDNVGILSFNLEGYSSSDVSAILSEDFNICVRGGYHCAPFVHNFIQSINQYGTIRVSVSAFTTRDDIDELIQSVEELSYE